MRTRTIRYVLAVRQEQSFTRAAILIGVSQPTLSIAVTRLEKQIGLRLFERKAPVRLTAAGRALLPLLQELDRCAGEFSRRAAFLKGRPLKVSRSVIRKSPKTSEWSSRSTH